MLLRHASQAHGRGQPLNNRGLVGQLAFSAVVLFSLQSARAQSPPQTVRRVAGVTKQITVPMVSEPWTATVSLPPRPLQKQARFIGHYPGFREAKQRANQATLRRLARKHFSMMGKAFALSLLAATTSTIVFDGPSESDTHVFPPDPQVASGPTQVVVAVNTLLAVYDKTGLLEGSFQQLSSFFSGLGVTGQISDPRLIYDQVNNRFILSAADVDLTNFTTGYVLLAISQTSDATGVWNKYAINFKGRNATNTTNTFPDFPGLGLRSTAVYVTSNQFELNSQCVAQLANSPCSFSDAWIEVLDLADLLAGNPTLTVTTFKEIKTASGQLAFSIQPALTYGTSDTEFLISASFSGNPSSALNVFAISSSGTLLLSEADLPVSPFSLPPDAAQASSNVPIDTGDFRLLNAVWNNGSLWSAQNVAASSGVGSVARWYEIGATGLSTLTVKQSGDIAGNANAYYPAITANSSGNATVVFETSGETEYIAVEFTGRSASDPPGTMRTPAGYAGVAQTYSEGRWGDYSGTSLDPDGQTVWVIGEFSKGPDPTYGTSVAKIGEPPAINVFPPSVNFSGVAVGSTTPPISVTLTNVSPNPVPIISSSLSGPNVAEFAISNDKCAGSTLASGASCSIAVTLTATAAGVRLAALVVSFTGVGSPVSVILQGTAFAQGVLTFSPPSAVFSDTPVFGVSPPVTFTAMNTGSEPLEIQAIGIDAADYTETNNCLGTMVIGGSCTISVTFRPTAPGPHPTVLNASTNAFVAPTGASITGTGIGVPIVVLCPSGLSFPNQVVGSSSTPQTAIITNTSATALTITQISTSGDFSETNNCGGGLAPQTACVTQIVFSPTTTGTRAGTLTITDDASGSPQTAPLVGTGVVATAQMIQRNVVGSREPQGGSQEAGQPPTPEGRELPERNPELSMVGGQLKSATDSQKPTVDPETASAPYGRLPLSFQANEGQTDPRVKFFLPGRVYVLFLTQDEAVLELQNRRERPEATSQPRSGCLL